MLLQSMVISLLSEVVIAFMKWPLLASALTFLLPRPWLAWSLTPFFTCSFLMVVFRHQHAAEAVTNLLRTQNAAKAMASLLRHHAALACVCEQPDAPALVAAVVGQPGLGAFLRSFLLEADHHELARFLGHQSTAVLIATVVCASDPVRAAAVLHRGRAVLAPAVTRLCCEPGVDAWAERFCSHPDMDRWIARFLVEPRGAVFARQVMLTPGFEGYVETVLSFKNAKAFVIRLLQQPQVCNFVTWLNRGATMRRWFAKIAARDNAMVFVTEMLLEPGLDRFVVQLLLRRGNDEALRAMLEYWVRAEGSLREVVASFAEKPKASQALARVIISPGFLDTFVLRRLLLQPGLAGFAVDAVVLVGLRGLVETVLPLLLSTLAVALALGVEVTRPGLEELLEAMPPADEAIAFGALLLG